MAKSSTTKGGAAAVVYDDYYGFYCTINLRKVGDAAVELRRTLSILAQLSVDPKETFKLRKVVVVVKSGSNPTSQDKYGNANVFIRHTGWSKYVSYLREHLDNGNISLSALQAVSRSYPGYFSVVTV